MSTSDRNRGDTPGKGGGDGRGRSGGGKGGKGQRQGGKGQPGGRGQAKNRGQGGKGRTQGGKGRSQQGGGRRGGPPIDEKVAQLEGPLKKVLDRLPETQRRVLELRMGLVDGHPHDLSDTARELGLTMHEAKEIEQRAFAHIREAVPLDRLHKFLER